MIYTIPWLVTSTGTNIDTTRLSVQRERERERGSHKTIRCQRGSFWKW